MVWQRWQNIRTRIPDRTLKGSGNMRNYSLKKLREIKPYDDYIRDQYIDDIYLSATLHDIGKVGIPDTILQKPGKLTEEEFEAIKKHTIYGKKVIDEITRFLEDKSIFNLAEKIAYSHHEKWNGSGYPEGLSGDNIPLSARIVALVDVSQKGFIKRHFLMK